MKLRRNRQAISIVELMVVLGAISTLVGLLLPAVNAARGMARRIECSNRVRQIALACELRKDVIRSYPSGTLNGSSNFPYMGWMVEILPYHERTQEYTKSRSEYFIDPDFEHHTNFREYIPTYVCPNDGRIDKPRFSPRHQTYVALTSYMGVNGTNYLLKDGVLFLDSRVKDANIRDGKSNTLLIGERPPSTFFDYGWWYAGNGYQGSGTLDHTLGTNEIAKSRFVTCVSKPAILSVHDECSVSFFWSLHETSFVVAMSDCSVRLLSKPEQKVFEAMGTRDAADIFDSSDW